MRLRPPRYVDILLVIVCVLILYGIFMRAEYEGFQEQEEVGFIVPRCVRKAQQNILYKDCYEAIRRYHPDLKIIFIDDNSDKEILEDHPMTNVEVIQSEYPGAGEYLPYWYMLKRKPFKKAIFIQDSMILNESVRYDDVNDYMFLYEIGNVTGYAEDTRNLLQQTKVPEELEALFDSGKWSGCWGSMMVITAEFIDRLEEKVGISAWVSSVRGRPMRIGLESAIGVACAFVEPKEKVSLFGHVYEMNVMKYPGNEKRTLDMYLADKTGIQDSIIKVWNGR